MRTAKSKLRSLLLYSFASISVLAQGQVTTGTPPLATLAGGPDIINLANLNVHLDAPIISKAGRRMPFTYRLSYDSSFWTPGPQSWLPPSNPATWGWRGISEGEVGYLSYTSYTLGCDFSGHLQTIYEVFVYHDPFGTPHQFPGHALDSQCDGVTNLTGVAALDNSGYTLTTDVTSVRMKVTSSSGIVYEPPKNQSTGPGTVTDTNGNQMTTDGSTFTDTLGTTALTISGTPNPLTFTYPKLDNGTPGTASVTVNYQQYTISTYFNCPGISEYGPTPQNLVSSIVYPDGSTYSFTYETTWGHVPSELVVTGRLESITLPTGGRITYGYPNPNGDTSHDAINCSDGSALGLRRTTSDGVTNYTRAANTVNSALWDTTFTDAAGNQTVYTFSGILETQRKIYQGSSTNGTPLLTKYNCYNGNFTDCPHATVSTPIIAKFDSTQWPNGRPVSSTQTNYNGYGLVSLTDDGLGRLTTISYASLDNGIVDRPSQIILTDSANNQISKTTYSYDEPGSCCGNPTGAPQHVAISGSRGNLSTVARWWNTTGGTVNTTFAYDDTGQITSTTDPGGHTTSFAYGNSNAYVTQVTMPHTNWGGNNADHITHATYDSNTGLMTSSTDQNGYVTSFLYDYMLRPTLTTYPDGGQTSIRYDGANRTLTRQKVDSSDNWTEHWEDHDGYGRLERVADRNGEAQPIYHDMKDYCYSPAGAKSFATYTYQGSGWNLPKACSVSGASITSTKPGDTTSLDALGRPLSLTHSDGSSVQYTYAGQAIQITGESNGTTQVKRILQNDDYGRLVKVCEATSTTLQGYGNVPGDCGVEITGVTGFPTTYTYDLLDNLTKIQQGGQFDRVFTYDSLSRLISEKEAESPLMTTTYTYSAEGLLATRTRPRPNQTDPNTTVTTGYGYDQLHRLALETYDGIAARTYYYEEPWQANRIGRLTTAWVNGGSWKGYSYDSMGRVTANGHGTNGTGDYTVTYTYDLLGNAKTQTDGLGHTYTFNRNPAGRLSSITSSFSDAQHPGTLFSNVHYAAFGPALSTFGNGIKEQRSYDGAGYLKTTSLTNSNTSPISRDLGTWTSSSGTFSVTSPSAPGSSSTQQLGQTGDVPVPGDYDGDGKTDYAVWRPGNGAWYVLPSGIPGNMITQQWGIPGDTPVPADYDGDGKIDYAVYRPSNGTWYIIYSSNSAQVTTPWGANWLGDTPVPGDYDGDGKADVAVYRTSNGMWYIIYSSNGSQVSQQWGATSLGDMPVPADYDGDGKADIAVWRPTNGTWYVIPSSNPGTFWQQVLGASGDVAVPADYDGDNKIDYAVWRPSNGNWYIIPSTNPSSPVTLQFGASGDKPVSGKYKNSQYYNFALNYAPDGSVTKAYDATNGNWSYTYDEFNRLYTSSKNGGQQAFRYEYDRFGNRWNQVVTAGSGPGPSYQFGFSNRVAGALNNCVSSTVYCYDLLGNLLNDGFHTYTYDNENRLTQVDGGATASYLYYADGTRLKVTAGGTSRVYLYDLEGRGITELNATGGAWNRGEIYAGGRHLGTYTPSTTNFIHPDWLGTKRVTTGPTGSAVETCTNLPFADGRNCTGTELSASFFTDMFHDSESNLEHTWFRQYTSTQGRWLTPDPYMGSMDLTNPQSLNRYAYVMNDPSDNVDPDGLDCTIAIQNPQNRLTDSQLSTMKAELTRIFGLTHSAVVFGNQSPDFTIIAAMNPRTLNPKLTDQTVGYTIPNGNTITDRSYVFIDVLKRIGGSFAPFQQNSNLVGVGAGRAGFHEFLHWALQKGNSGHTAGTPFQKSFTAEQYFGQMPQQTQIWTPSKAQTAAVQQKCGTTASNQDAGADAASGTRGGQGPSGGGWTFWLPEICHEGYCGYGVGLWMWMPGYIMTQCDINNCL